MDLDPELGPEVEQHEPTRGVSKVPGPDRDEGRREDKRLREDLEGLGGVQEEEYQESQEGTSFLRGSKTGCTPGVSG